MCLVACCFFNGHSLYPPSPIFLDRFCVANTMSSTCGDTCADLCLLPRSGLPPPFDVCTPVLLCLCTHEVGGGGVAHAWAQVARVQVSNPCVVCIVQVARVGMAACTKWNCETFAKGLDNLERLMSQVSNSLFKY